MNSVENGGDRPFHTLIEADNYHALQLLEYLYAGQVDCIYIDPPYNTGAKDWKYNNNYVDVNDSWRHSKWLAMMRRRLIIAESLLKPEGIICITIDDCEILHLLCLLEQTFQKLKVLGTVVIKTSPSGRPSTQGFRVSHEYAIFVGGINAKVGRFGMSEGQKEFFSEDDIDGPYAWQNLRKRGGANTMRKARPRQYYPIFVSKDSARLPNMSWNKHSKTWLVNDMPSSKETELFPIGDDGRERIWSLGAEKFIEDIESTRIQVRYDERERKYSIWRKIRPNKEGSLPSTWWDSANYSIVENGSKLIGDILNKDKPFPFPKSPYAVVDCLLVAGAGNQDALIIDFFAGSATTLNAVNLMNAADNGNRRCILVTNNEVSADEAKTLQEQGLMPGDAEYEKHGICQSVTWPRSKYTILGKRDDGTLLDGDYLTGRTVTKDKRRIFKQIGFIDKAQLDSTARKKELAALLDGIPQSKIDKDTVFFVDENCAASVLFDETFADAYLDALEDMGHIETFYLVTANNNALFKRLKDSINESLGPLQVSEDEKRPLSAGFEANLAYFKLDFLDADEVQLGRKFAALLPILWLMAGAKGPCPQADGSGPFFLPERCPFAVLLDEHDFLPFKQALQARADITHVFLVTNSEEGFFAMRDEMDSRLQVIQLYKNYLDRFKINTEQRGRA
jgi:adenine-specific DNA-methyltransferase